MKEEQAETMAQMGLLGGDYLTVVVVVFAAPPTHDAQSTKRPSVRPEVVRGGD